MNILNIFKVMISSLSAVKKISGNKIQEKKEADDAVFCCTGKTGYMAPETINNAIATPESNIFTLGEIYYGLFRDENYLKLKETFANGNNIVEDESRNFLKLKDLKGYKYKIKNFAGSYFQKQLMVFNKFEFAKIF